MVREVFGHPGNPPELLARVQARTLIIVGDEEYGGDAEARKAQQAIPGARLVTIPGAGHMVMDDVDALTVPDDLAEALAAHPPATDNFAAFPNSTQRWTPCWVKITKTPRTRHRRIRRAPTPAAHNERVPRS